MKRFRSLIALALSLALILVSPGSSAYHAAAQTMGSAASGASSAGNSGAVGANLGRGAGVSAIPSISPSALTLSPSLSAPSIAPSAMGLAAVIPAASAASPIFAVPSAPKGAAAAKAVVPGSRSVSSAKSAISALNAGLSAPSAEPETAEQSADGGRRQFDGDNSPYRSAAVDATPDDLILIRRSSLDAPTLKIGGAPIVDGGIGRVKGAADAVAQPGRLGLIKMFGLGLLGGGAMTVAGTAFGSIALFPMIIGSLVLHEMGHSYTADKLGDPTGRLQNRGPSLNPRHWMTHIDPVWTLLIPAATFLSSGMIFGGARPVPVEPRYFKNPVRDMAIVALAGPAVNAGLAIAGALAISGAVAAGFGAGVVATLGMFVFLNLLLAIFNFIPLPPLDGSHMLKAFLPYQVRAAIDGFMASMGPMSILPVMILFMFAGGAISAVAMLLAKLLIGGVTGVQMASAFLPAVAALGLAFGRLIVPGAPDNIAPAPASPNGPVDLIVMFGATPAKLHDAHLSNVDVNNGPLGAEQYTRLQQSMLAQLATAGLDEAALEPYKGTPLATYARINAATIKIDRTMIADFVTDMQDRGFKVYPNSERRIIQPVPVSPEQLDPAARNAVTMDENLRIVKADVVQAEAEKLWGKPELGFWSGLWASVFKTAPVQPKFGVIDSGADVSHPLLKRVKEVKNMTSGENVDDIGHGSWVHSTVLHMAPWSRNTTHYKTFLNGGATLDDILRSLTQAGNDGNLVISNSWGDDFGDPKGPDAQLVLKLAQEGHIMVFAGGNAGSGKNTIGAPAIVTYKDAATGAIRVLAVAAAGRDKKIASFSSRGPGSPATSRTPGYPHRPDLTAVGYNIEGAWPAALNEADRVDGPNGPVKAISGTSMSTPGVAGALALLATMFGVTEKGAKLDAVVNAVMSTLEKTGQPADAEGEGFLNVDAAYKKLQGVFSMFSGSVTEYRELKSRLNTLRQLRARTTAWHYSSAGREYFSKISAEIPEIEARLKAMESADQTLAYRAAGPVKRLLLKATGAAPRL